MLTTLLTSMLLTLPVFAQGTSYDPNHTNIQNPPANLNNSFVPQAKKKKDKGPNKIFKVKRAPAPQASGAPIGR